MLLGGSFILGAIIMAMAMIHFALTDGTGNVDPPALQALNLLDGNFWVAANPALGLMMLGAAGWLLGRLGNYNRLGWVALVLGSGLFIRFVDFFALLLSLLWIIVTSVMLYRTPQDERAEAGTTKSTWARSAGSSGQSASGGSPRPSTVCIIPRSWFEVRGQRSGL